MDFFGSSYYSVINLKLMIFKIEKRKDNLYCKSVVIEKINLLVMISVEYCDK